ncbi:hypothetical protein Pfo_031183 [Paulownia fortunei]|nr:hypothetical protein Pfo_031183 [Paulownia fortunei]
MADTRGNIEINKALCDYAIPMVVDTLSEIRPPVIQENNFEIKLTIIQMIIANKFGGLTNEDPNAHKTSFLEICHMFKYNDVTDDAIRLRLFPFSLQDKAKIWLNSLHTGTITTWARLAYKDILRRCPHHGLPNWLQVQTFYNGLSGLTRTLVDAAAGGALMGKTHEEAYDLIETMTANAYQWPSGKITPKKVFGVHDVDALATLTAQVAAILSQQFNSLHTNPAPISVEVCNFCSGPHHSTKCQVENLFAPSQPEQAQFVGNANWQNNPYSNTYNPGWRNHPNSYGIKKFMERTEATLQKQESIIHNQSASIRNMEVHIGQIANMLSIRSQDSFSSNTKTNPKENVHAITLRSGKELSDLERKVITTNELAKEIVVEKSDDSPNKEVEKPKSKLFPDNPSPYVPHIPFPQCFQKQKLDKQFSKFLDVFKKLHINIPFADALEQMPSYVKFMKEILSNKQKLEEYKIVALTEECSAILQKKLPPKLKDPGSFMIPCSIGNSFFDKALCDLGASINLMSLSVYRKLGLGEAKPTTVSLQLADKSVKYPRGIIEDVLVKVDKFIFPAYFIVLDMEEDQDILIILGLPFLVTGRALIDVQKGELILRVQDEQVPFNVFKKIKYPSGVDNCLRVETIDKCMKVTLSE